MPFLRTCVLCAVLELHLTLCNPIDCSPPGPSVLGDFPGKNAGGVVMPSSRGSSNPGTDHRSPTLQADSLPSEPPGKPKNSGVGSLSLLQRILIFPIQEWNQGLLLCRQVLYQLPGKQLSPRYTYTKGILVRKYYRPKWRLGNTTILNSQWLVFQGERSFYTTTSFSVLST